MPEARRDETLPLVWRSLPVRLSLIAIPIGLTTTVLVFNVGPAIRLIAATALVVSFLSPVHGLLLVATFAPIGRLVAMVIGAGEFRIGEVIVLAFFVGWLLRARLAWRRDSLRAATAAANESFAEARKGIAGNTIDDGNLADQADALLVLGSLQQAQLPGTPPPAWAEAHALLAGRARASYYWRVLDPWVRLCRLTGDAVRAQVAFDRLNASGYVPLQPWPATSQPSPVTEGDQHVH